MGFKDSHTNLTDRIETPKPEQPTIRYNTSLRNSPSPTFLHRKNISMIIFIAVSDSSATDRVVGSSKSKSETVNQKRTKTESTVYDYKTSFQSLRFLKLT